jgi:PKD repeat protein
VILPNFFVTSQTVLFQDTWFGGVTGAGANIGDGISVGASLSFSNYILPNSTIRKAFLIAGSGGSNGEIEVNLNNFSVIFNNNTIVTTDFFAFVTNFGYGQIHAKDITEFINANNSNFTLTVPAQSNILNQRFHSFYLIIAYENSSLGLVNCTLVLNNQNSSSIVNYYFQNINPISTDNDVGISICGYAFCNTVFDGTIVLIENQNIGLVGGNDFNALFSCSGTQGHFYYQDAQFFGLGDDEPNETMNDYDAIANIKNIINQGAGTLSVDFIHQSTIPAYSSSNPIVCAALTYTSPCQPFEATLLTSDTTTCLNTPVQLGVTVPDTINATYEWLPQTNLSCYDCPNPIFTGDSTINYTVRIWSTDSCSKVLPVRVRVVPQPNFESINLTENICGFESGSIIGTSVGLALPHTYQLNDGAPQNNFNFSNLPSGTYTITITDANGCSRDSTVQINDINNIQAAFTVNPSTGDAPLQVQTQNNSQNATQYQWFWEDQSSTLTNPSITLDTAGIYTLMLVAGNGAAHCNDTASVIILVREPFEVFAYTFVTNEANVYQIYLSGVSEYKYDLYTLDGKLVYQKSGAVENAGFVDLWEIGGVASSVYLFRIWVKAESGVEDEIKGKLVVVR